MSNGFKGRKNVYTCQMCGESFVTIDRDEGTTPFMTKCHEDDCIGNAQSAFYRVDQSLPATHEWYRASDVEVRTRGPGWRGHHEMGGLFLRKIKAES
jgi:hypothetical protein